MAWMPDLVVDFGRPLVNFVRAFVGAVGAEDEGATVTADAIGKPSVLSVNMLDWLKTGGATGKVAVEGDDGFATYTPGKGFEFTELDGDMCAPAVALVLPPCVTQGRPAEIELMLEPLSVAARVVGSCGDKVFLDRRVSKEEAKLGFIRAKLPSFKEHCVVDVLLIPVVEDKPCQCKVVPVCVLPEAAAEGLHSIFFQMVEACEKLTKLQGVSPMKQKLETCKGVWKNNFSDFIHDLEAFMMCCSGPRRWQDDAFGEELLELFQRMLECSIHYRARGFALFLVAKAVDGGIEVNGAEGLSELGQQEGVGDYRVGNSAQNGCRRDSLDAEMLGPLPSVRSLPHNDSAFQETADIVSTAESGNGRLCAFQEPLVGPVSRPSSKQPAEMAGSSGRGFVEMLMDSAICSRTEGGGTVDLSKRSKEKGGMGAHRWHEMQSPPAGCNIRGGKEKKS